MKIMNIMHGKAADITKTTDGDVRSLPTLVSFDDETLIL